MKYDELTIGQKFETQTYKVSKEEIITFATQFDPQFMHIDEEKAKQSKADLKESSLQGYIR
jgi:acyl dehydratase